MPEVLVTPAADTPVNLDEVKLHLRVTHDQEDTEILSLIDDATRFCEDRIGQQFITATWRYSLPSFPSGSIIVPRAPLISVTSITYVDTNRAAQTLATAEYQVDTDSRPGRIAEAPLKFWPDIDTDTFNPVKVTYAAGYGAATEDVPPAAKRAIKMLVGHWYHTREPVIIGSISGPIELTLDSLLASLWHGEYAGARQ